MMVSHGACGARWWQKGNLTGHCSVCHLNFDSLRAFDLHRVGGECLDPSTARKRNGSPIFESRIGRHEQDAGVVYWRTAGDRPDFWKD